MRYRIARLAAWLLAATACTESTSPPTGVLQVVVTTAGIDLDQDGYRVTIGQRAPIDIPVNDTLVLDVRDGPYRVTLGGLASNCVHGGSGYRDVIIDEDRSEVASFSVTCGAMTGVLRIEVQTIGDLVDPDGYQLAVTAPAPGHSITIPANGFVLLPGLVGGSYQVTISGISPSCATNGSNPRHVTVATGQLTRDTALAVFQVACLGGVVAITAPTTGLDPDSAYTVSVDGGPPVPLAGADSLAVALEVGDHSFSLGDVAPNCTVQGQNPVTLAIFQGARTSLAFSIQCIGNRGTARISAVVTGSTLDTGLNVGTDVTCDWWYYICDYARVDRLPPGGSIAIDLPPGNHSFELLDLAANCLVTGGSSQVAAISVGDTSDVRFDVTCSPAGTLRVTTRTSGALPDDQYVVFLDDQWGMPIAADATIDLATVIAGWHVVSLGDVSSSCRVAGANPQVVNLSADVVNDIVFQVDCDPNATLVIAAPTTGGDQDIDYLAIVDNGSPLPVVANDSISVRVYGGSHTVNLVGLNFNCSYAVSTPVSIFVPVGGTATATIPVNCVPYTGTARFTLTATGQNPPSGLLLDYNCYWNGYYCEQLTIPMNGATSVSLNPGSYVFSVYSAPVNCSVSPGTSVQVNVALGVTTETAFSLSCQ